MAILKSESVTRQKEDEMRNIYKNATSRSCQRGSYGIQGLRVPHAEDQAWQSTAVAMAVKMHRVRSTANFMLYIRV